MSSSHKVSWVRRTLDALERAITKPLQVIGCMVAGHMVLRSYGIPAFCVHCGKVFPKREGRHA